MSYRSGREGRGREQCEGGVLEIDFNDDDEQVLDEPAPTPATPAEATTPSTSAKEDDGVPAKWESVNSHKNIVAAIGSAPSVICQHCGYECTSRKRLLLHARVHWVHCLCKGGYPSK